jgi:uncharacterized protein YabE (DUF348 family)
MKGSRLKCSGKFLNQNNVQNLNHVERDGKRNFRNKKKVYLKAKIVELENNGRVDYIMNCYKGFSDLRTVTNLELI